MLRVFVFLILSLLTTNIASAREWQPAEEIDAKALVNCLIDHWLRDRDFGGHRGRWELHINIVNVGDFKVPREDRARLHQPFPSERFFCVKRRQADYSTRLFRDGSLALSNGKPIGMNGQREGYVYGIMHPYRKGSLLAVYVQSGSWSSRKTRDGKDCVYDATASASRFYFRRNENSLTYVGRRGLWVADVGLPDCMREFERQYFVRPAFLRAGKNLKRNKPATA